MSQYFDFHPSPVSFGILAVLLLLCLTYVVYLVVKAHRGRVTTGMEALIGRAGTIISVTEYGGKIRINGELWYFRSDRTLAVDDTAEVVDADEMTLVVRKKG
jgi:membrane protein implicated in regulation of membrane protease activity